MDATQLEAEIPDLNALAPALEHFRERRLFGDLWKRPELTPRDRSVVTLATVIARNQPIELPDQLNRALDNGVSPREISEIITHLAFYSGWANSMLAVAAAGKVFAVRGIGIDQLPSASPRLLPLDEAAEADRAARVGQQLGSAIPGLVQYTTDVLFRDLWLRPDLAPRDPLFQVPDSPRISGAAVTFEPGARTAWHTHPLGQTLVVLAGCGRVQRWGGRSRRFDRATSSGFRPAKSTGTARRQRPP